MQFVNSKAEASAMETKGTLLDLMFKYGVKQELVSFACGVDQTQVSRWLNPHIGAFPPIHLLINCLQSNVDILQQLATSYLDALEMIAGRSASPLVVATDGKMDDEFRDSVIIDGEFAEALNRNDLKKMEELAHRAQAVAQRMFAEIKLARQQTREARR